MKFLKNIYHKILPLLGAVVYGFPSKKIVVIGVTGTKGKTTVTELINAGLEAAGYKTALNNSIRRKVGEASGSNKGNSMFGRMYLQKFLREAVNTGCKYAIIEVTSEGVRQHRHERIEFDAAVFINIHPEHIESHGSFEKYREAKLEFFRYVKNYSKKPHKYFFVNHDDENSSHFIKVIEPADITYFSKSDLQSGLFGDFNKSNVGVAVAVLKKLGIKDEIINRGMANFKGVPGRMEFVQREPFAVVVDYAHTPESLEAVYQTLSVSRSNVNGQSSMVVAPVAARKLICVLGSAGGGRDKWKRPEFGKIAERYCKEIILTDEDPYDENPESILEQIESGFSQTLNPKSETLKNFWKILDRREAIKKAIELAKPGDVVIMTGKGSEKSIHVAGGKTIPWSDSSVALEALKEKYAGQ